MKYLRKYALSALLMASLLVSLFGALPAYAIDDDMDYDSGAYFEKQRAVLQSEVDSSDGVTAAQMSAATTM